MRRDELAGFYGYRQRDETDSLASAATCSEQQHSGIGPHLPYGNKRRKK
jgi:hypothetical protein